MGYVVPSFFILTENEAESPWGWSFITPALITMVTAVVAFFVLVPGQYVCMYISMYVYLSERSERTLLS